MTNLSNVRDVTMTLRIAQASPPMLLLFMCGTARDPHKGVRTGSKMRGNLPWICPACVAKKAAA